MTKPKKWIYSFGGGKAEGRAEMKNLLGGKGANLAEMSSLGTPVPAGFTITTEVCEYYYDRGRKYPKELINLLRKHVRKIERTMGKKFGDHKNPLLVSVRSGARQSMPGMMETVLNVGLTSKTLPGLVARTNNPRLAYDAYRRLITMYSDVVMEKAAGIEPKEGKGIRAQLEHLMAQKKKMRGVVQDTELTADDLKALCASYKRKVKHVLKKPFPDEANRQLWGAIGAVFQSWNGKRAISYRRIEGIPDEWGTAVNVQAMVFGNTGERSATGVAFTRNPATGENKLYGEWLPNAQGEDVVAGIRTPNPIDRAGKTEETRHLQSLEEAMPKAYKRLVAIRNRLEKHYRDMQDLEFTIEEGRLWMLQTRTGKRTGTAAIQMAVDMVRRRMISREEAVLRVKPEQLEELLHPMVDPKAEGKTKAVAKGLPAGPGGAAGQAVFTADAAEAWKAKGKRAILLRNETSPEDVHGMHAAEAILTAKGGMTSHAALVARGWGKCCIVGCGALHIDAVKKIAAADGKVIKEGDWLTLNGTKGLVYLGALNLLPVDPEGNPAYRELMQWADRTRRLKVRTNADRPEDAAQARAFGAQGIGLTRTEHMFFGPDRIMAVREMIFSEDEARRRRAVMELLPFQRKDFVGIFKAMRGLPVTIRLLDPPLHEFLPHTEKELKALAKQMGLPLAKIKARAEGLKEVNPMLGHRGCRLGVTYPEITEMQARAIFEAAAQCLKRKIKAIPEVMVPLIGTRGEFDNQKAIIDTVAAEVMKQKKIRIPYLVGTMIEIPRAALMADKIAETAEFFSFGTNDLTQMTFGYSRDDVGSFMPGYVDSGILREDPFEVLDQEGVGQLVNLGIERGRSTQPDLKVGICGEHGGEPSSVGFCHRAGMDYVSCSPFRVPIARLAAAHAALADKRT